MDMKRAVIPRLHDTGMNFRAGMKISLRHKNRSELAPVWLASAWHFVLVSCKRIQSHEREPEWIRAGMKVAPISCKHPLRQVRAWLRCFTVGLCYASWNLSWCYILSISLQTQTCQTSKLISIQLSMFRSFVLFIAVHYYFSSCNVFPWF